MGSNLALLIPTLGNGGAERVASNLSCNLPQEINQKIILYDGSQVEYPYKGDLIDLKIPGSNNPFIKLQSLIKRTSKLRQLKEKYDIDVILSFLDGANIINLLSKKQERIILSTHNFKSRQSTGVYGIIHKNLIKRFYNKADNIVVPSEMVKVDLTKNFNIIESKINVINNSFDIERINKLSKKELDVNYKKIFKYPVIINVGRLTGQKGQWHLIRAFKKVKKEIPEAKLVFLGRGELEDYLKDLSKKIGLEEDIYFLGFQNNPFKFINKAKVFAFSSIFEGFGNVLIESMACGTPVVSTDCKAGPREILAPDTDIEQEIKDIEYAKYGLLTPVCDGDYCEANQALTNNEEMLAKGIIEIIKNKKLRKKYCSSLQERVNDFKIEKIIHQWLEILKIS